MIGHRRAWWTALCLLGFGFIGTPAGAATGQVWLLRSGEEYFGTATSYDFASRDLTITKADGKTFTFAARDLAFSAKLQLIDSPAFGEALKSYRPPFLPALSLSLGLAVAFCVPAIIGLWSSAHLFGAVASPLGHLGGFLKVLAVALLQAGIWLVSAIGLDSGQPLLPDTNADIVMSLTVLVVGLLAASLVIALHYQRSFWKGMAITCLAGVFSGIVATAMGLASLYYATRVDYETLVTRVVFEPFAVF